MNLDYVSSALVANCMKGGSSLESAKNMMALWPHKAVKGIHYLFLAKMILHMRINLGTILIMIGPGILG